MHLGMFSCFVDRSIIRGKYFPVWSIALKSRSCRFILGREIGKLMGTSIFSCPRTSYVPDEAFVRTLSQDMKRFECQGWNGWADIPNSHTRRLCGVFFRLLWNRVSYPSFGSLGSAFTILVSKSTLAIKRSSWQRLTIHHHHILHTTVIGGPSSLSLCPFHQIVLHIRCSRSISLRPQAPVLVLVVNSRLFAHPSLRTYCPFVFRWILEYVFPERILFSDMSRARGYGFVSLYPRQGGHWIFSQRLRTHLRHFVNSMNGNP